MKHLISICFLLTTFIANAQIAKGDKMIGLSISYIKTTRSDGSINQPVNSSTYQNFKTKLSTSYFISNNIAVGFGLGYSNYNYREIYNKGDNISKSKESGISPFIMSKYMLKLGGNFYYSPMAQIYYRKVNDNSERYYKPTNTTEKNSGKGNEYGAIINPLQFGVLVKNRFFIELSMADIFFQNSKSEDKSPSNVVTTKKYNYFGVNLPFNYSEGSSPIEVSVSFKF